MTAKIFLLLSFLVWVGCFLMILVNPGAGLALIAPFGFGLISFSIFIITLGYMFIFKKMNNEIYKRILVLIVSALFLSVLYYAIWFIWYS